MRTSKIRPGLLVALKSSVHGGVQYARVDLETGEKRQKWETTKMVEDPEEHDRATKARSKAQSEIRGACAWTSFGLLCPKEQEDLLDEAIARAKAVVKAHNDSATSTYIDLFVLKGEVASTDEEAVNALMSEMSGLVTEMNQGIDKLDPKVIREAADKARRMAAILGDDQRVTITEAIDQARKAARQIVKRVEKEGEQAAIVLADIQRGALEKARIAFLDLDAPTKPAEPMPVGNAQRFADLPTEN